MADDETNRPDARKACQALDVDAVFAAAMTDYKHGIALDGMIIPIGSAAIISRAIVGSKKSATLQFSLADCHTGELLWASTGAVSEKKGFMWARINGFTVLCEMLLTMPRYQEPGK